jgi:hypothetical protein
MKTDEQTRALKEWVKALRSGEYKQTKHRLRDKEGYCCLGVACEVISGIFDDIVGYWDNYLWISEDRYGQESEEVQLPEVIANRLGIDRAGELVVPVCGTGSCEDDDDDLWTSLAMLNDGGASFDFIADVIEKQFINGISNPSEVETENALVEWGHRQDKQWVAKER